MSKEIPQFLVQPKEPVQFAFTCGDVDYWHFVDASKIPSMRALQFWTFNEEWRSRTTRELYEKETAAEEQLAVELESELSGKSGKINLVKAVQSMAELKKILKNRRERMGLIFEADTFFKMASVVFFDKNENPYRYDFKYNEEKIKKWKADANLNDFFLSMPIKDLAPYLSELGDNSQDYSLVSQKVMELQSKFLSTIISRRRSMIGSPVN